MPQADNAADNFTMCIEPIMWTMPMDLDESLDINITTWIVNNYYALFCAFAFCLPIVIAEGRSAYVYDDNNYIYLGYETF